MSLVRLSVAKEYANGQSLNFNVTYDSLSGATPNGALTSHSPQTFASPSGKASHEYTTAPGQLPVDPHYEDDRIALGGNWTVPLTRVDQVSVGAKLSDEHDFFSATANASIAHDFNEKNTTLSFGVDNEYDSLHPIGGAPVPGSDYALFEKTGGGKTKDGIGVLLGITQAMTRNWLTEFNLAVVRTKSPPSSTVPAIPPDMCLKAAWSSARARARIGRIASPGIRKCRALCRCAI